MEQIKRILAQHPFFEGVGADVIEFLAGAAKKESFNAGDFLVREDKPGHCFFLVLKGKVVVEVTMGDRKPVIVSTISENDIFGYCWIVPPYQCRFDGRAVEPTEAICIDGGQLRKICLENHQAGYLLLKRTSKVMSLLLDATRLQVLDMYSEVK